MDGSTGDERLARDDPPHGSAGEPNESAPDRLRRCLRLELERVQHETKLIELKARASELQRQLEALDQADSPSIPTKISSPSMGSMDRDDAARSSDRTNAGIAPAGWDDVREAQRRYRRTLLREDAEDEAGHAERAPFALGRNRTADNGVRDWAVADVSDGRTETPLQSVRFDSAESLRSPHFDAEAGEGTDKQDASGFRSDPETSIAAGEATWESSEPKIAPELEAIGLSDSGVESDTGSRRRGMPLVVSTVVHLALIVALALIGLQVQPPKDQVSLTASSPPASEASFETFEMEVVEPTESTEVSEVVEEVQYEIDPVGTLPASLMPPPPSDFGNPLESLESLNSSASLSEMVSEDVNAVQFCGVSGGGNHFVYLVDSSGSMGEAFDSARMELLHSVDQLTSDQRFYVVFFDADSDYMRIRDPGKAEDRSVKATAENKATLRRWAMTIRADRGKAPYDAIEFALGLRPDVIFLLSDGEFPQGIEDLLKEQNHQENLFGDAGPISIVHTISYHSKEGEDRMRRIAKQNGGMYRYVAR